MIITSQSRNGKLLWRREETIEQYGARLAAEKPIEHLTTSDIAAARAEERRRRQLIGGCCAPSR